MESASRPQDPPRRRISRGGIVVAIFSVVAGAKMLVDPGPFGTPFSVIAAWLGAGVVLFGWSLLPKRRTAIGVAAWFGGFVAGFAAGMLLGGK